MEKIMGQETGMPEKKKTAAFNFNKLQAVFCIAASATVSIALIVWAIKAFW
ncbi:MAG: hypothetical protein ACXWJF_12900 [Burkholderiaceae bacterium]